MRFARVTLAALLLGAAACGEEAAVDIRAFELERAEPPADARGGKPLVRPRADLHFRWKVDGELSRLRLTANEKTIADLRGAALGPTGSDPCTEERCSTSHLGEVEYRLTAWDDDGRSVSRTLPVRVAEQGLQILTFTSQPESIDPGASVTLRWETAGGAEVHLSATPVGGGEARQLGTFTGDDATSGTLVDEGVASSTLYRLVLGDGAGGEIDAEITVPRRGEAFFTSLEADPAQVVAGQSTTLSWESVGLEALTILRSDGGATFEDIGADELDQGSRKVEIGRETTFTFVGVSRDGEVVTQRCDDTGCSAAGVTVTLHPGPAIVSFAADEAEIPAGEGTTLRWEVLQADEVVITWAEAGGSGELQLAADATSARVEPDDTARYTLVATGGGLNASRQLTLGVRPAVSLSGPEEVAAGSSFEVSWQSRGATMLTLRVNGDPVPLGPAQIAAGSVTIEADAAPGEVLEVVLVAEDDENPRRSGEARLRVNVG